MPTVLWLGRLRVVVYFNDHRPADVHVIGNGCEVVFGLHCPAGPVSVRENYGFNRRGIARLKEALTNQLSALCRAWEDIHGDE